VLVAAIIGYVVYRFNLTLEEKRLMVGINKLKKTTLVADESGQTSLISVVGSFLVNADIELQEIKPSSVDVPMAGNEPLDMSLLDSPTNVQIEMQKTN